MAMEVDQIIFRKLYCDIMCKFIRDLKNVCNTFYRHDFRTVITTTPTVKDGLSRKAAGEGTSDCRLSYTALAAHKRTMLEEL